MTKKRINQLQTYEIREKSSGELIETTRTWTTAKNLIIGLKQIYGDLELIKVK